MADGAKVVAEPRYYDENGGPTHDAFCCVGTHRELARLQRERDGLLDVLVELWRRTTMRQGPERVVDNDDAHGFPEAIEPVYATLLAAGRINTDGRLIPEEG